MLSLLDTMSSSRAKHASVRGLHLRTFLVAAVTLSLAGVATPAHAATGELARFATALGTVDSPDSPGTALDLQPAGVAVDQTTGKVYVSSRTADAALYGPIFVFDESGVPAGQVDLGLAPGVAVAVAVDGPRKRLLIGTFDSVFGAGLKVESVPTDDLAAEPTTVIDTAATEAFFGNAVLAVDQSTDATLGGRVFVGFNTSDPETINDPADPSSGFVAEFSKTGTFVRKIGRPIAPDGAVPPVPGVFLESGAILRVAVSTDTHALHVQDATSQLHTFNAAGSPTGVRTDVVDAFAAAADGTLWFRAGGQEVEPLLRFAPGAPKPLSIPGADGTTTPGGAQSPKACQLFAATFGAAGRSGSAYFASISQGSTDQYAVVRIGPGGKGCGLDPVLGAASATPSSPTVGTTVQLTASGTSPESLGLTYEWDLDGNPATGAQGFEATTPTGSGTVTPTKAGVLAVRVRLRDAQGSVSAIRSLDVDVAAGSGGSGGVLPTPAPTTKPTPAPSPAPTQAPLAQPTAAPTPAPPAAPTTTTTLKGSVRKGLSVKVTCAAACTGTLELKSAKGTVLAKGSYSKTGSVKLKLTKAGKKALAKSKKAKATLVITPSAGTATSTKVSLRLSRS
jgi:hypothetical protein